MQLKHYYLTSDIAESSSSNDIIKPRLSVNSFFIFWLLNYFLLFLERVKVK